MQLFINSVKQKYILSAVFLIVDQNNSLGYVGVYSHEYNNSLNANRFQYIHTTLTTYENQLFYYHFFSISLCWRFGTYHHSLHRFLCNLDCKNISMILWCYCKWHHRDNCVYWLCIHLYLYKKEETSQTSKMERFSKYS